jgi:hypothetical protein
MNWPEPTRQAHHDFCLIEGWKPVRNARGGTGSDHLKFELQLPDGRILRTRVSHPPNRETYGPRIWSHILRDQLDVSEADFWACVHDKAKPRRGASEVPKAVLPADLVFTLLNKVGLSAHEVASMSRDEAIARVNRHWTEAT